jgi:site-specific DNA recombinase
VVPVIFELYAFKRMGTRAVANWLNDAVIALAREDLGAMSRWGPFWSRTYLGEVYFRGQWHPASHQPLVEPGLFAAAEAILTERSTDICKRASASSDHLLTGLVLCGQCGQHYTGSAAHGRSARYRYYTCRSRHKYGSSSACSAERLPADELDAAVLDALLTAYEQTDRFERALKESAGKLTASKGKYEAEIKTIDGEIANAEEGIKRYLLAFESGSLPEIACGQRIRELTTRIAELTDRRAGLSAELEGKAMIPPTEVELAQLRSQVRTAIEKGLTSLRKALVQALVSKFVSTAGLDRPVLQAPRRNAKSGCGSRAVQKTNRLPITVEGTPISLATVNV